MTRPPEPDVIEAMAKALRRRYMEKGNVGEWRDLAEFALAAADEARGMQVEKRVPHDAYVDCIDGGWAGYQAACRVCFWRGTHHKRDSKTVRGDCKDRARTEAVLHEQSGGEDARLVSAWRPVEQEKEGA